MSADVQIGRTNPITNLYLCPAEGAYTFLSWSIHERARLVACSLLYNIASTVRNWHWDDSERNKYIALR